MKPPSVSPRRNTIVLLDDNAEVLKFHKKHIVAHFDRSVECVAFLAVQQAIHYVVNSADRIIGYIQDMNRSDDLRGDESRNVIGFYHNIIERYTPEAKCLFISGTPYSPDVAKVFELGDRVRWLSKSDLAQSGIASNLLDWLVTPPTPENILPADGNTSATVVLLAPPWQALCRYIAEHEDYLHKMDSRDFEKLSADIFRSFGWEVELTAPTKDGGCDVIAVRRSSPSEMRVLVEAKRYSPGKNVGVDIVRSLYGVKQSKSASQLVLVTSSFVTLDAKKEFARVVPWELDFFERDMILEWCRNQSSVELLGDFG